jgi:hypothetical protein
LRLGAGGAAKSLSYGGGIVHHWRVAGQSMIDIGGQMPPRACALAPATANFANFRGADGH